MLRMIVLYQWDHAYVFFMDILKILFFLIFLMYPNEKNVMDNIFPNTSIVRKQSSHYTGKLSCIF